MTGMDFRSILGPVADHLVQTTTPISYTRPIMKNKFVDYGILSLDNFLNGRFRSMQRIPYLLEKEKMLKLRNNETLNTKTHYGAKPNMQQGILNTLLDFFGVKYLQGSELDKVLTDWIMENTPKYISKVEKT
uniref:Uncharacterized protein n=1 Tax=Meloidogyne javanica TaxID=6303 RepID=A0A915N4H4_MELJA